jgi:hypothetical protein
MSALKEEWASLIKLRESGLVDESKKQELKSRIFNNFYSLRQEITRDLPQTPQISVKPEFQVLRNQVLQTVLFTERTKTPDIPKKFEFGLRKITPPPTPNKINRPDIKSDDIWNIKDTLIKPLSEEFIPDKYEWNSVVDLNSVIFKPSLYNKKIDIFTDLSPITRKLCVMTEEDEEKYIKETKRHDNSLFGYIHLVRNDPGNLDLNKIEWDEMKRICTGCLLKSDIKILSQAKESSLKPMPELTKTEVSECLSEPPVILDLSLPIPANKKNSSSSVYLPRPEPKVPNIEADLLKMMDIIKSKKNSHDIENQLKVLLENTRKTLENNKDPASNIQIKVLYQFLLEYQKAQQHPVAKRPTQSKPTQKKNIRPHKINKVDKPDSLSSVSSSKSSKWIGGNKYLADFEDDDWVSLNQEKIKKETRNEKLYNQSFKNKK